MKNKEIEEILNYLKDENWDYYPADLIPYKVLLMEERDLLLSYIEQLEKRNKELYEGFMATQEELTDYAIKNEQLENNRDKAIEYLKEKADYPISYYHCIRETIDILKGDSDD